MPTVVNRTDAEWRDLANMHAQTVTSQRMRIAELEAALRKIDDTAKSHPYAGTTCGEIARAALKGRAKPPYPEFCRHPDKCAGLGCCPRDPTCAD